MSTAAIYTNQTRSDINHTQIRIEGRTHHLVTGRHVSRSHDFIGATRDEPGVPGPLSIEFTAAPHPREPRLKLNRLCLDAYVQTRMTMSTKTNIAAAAALLTALAAPELSFAQAMSHFNTSRQIGLANVPAAVFGSAIAPTRRRAPRTTVPPSDRTVTDPLGNVIGVRRDWRLGQD